MNEQENNPDKLDRLLDESLAQYAQAEPLTGLEDRILARLEKTDAEPAPWVFWTRWSWAVTAVVLVAGISAGMYLVTLQGDDVDHVGEDSAIEVNGGARVETETAALPPRIPARVFRTARPQIAVLRAVEAASATELRSEVFPAPAPLSEQERLALAYARFAKGQELAAKTPSPGLVELDVAPVEVPEIKVLESPGPESQRPSLQEPGLSKSESSKTSQ